VTGTLHHFPQSRLLPDAALFRLTATPCVGAEAIRTTATGFISPPQSAIPDRILALIRNKKTLLRRLIPLLEQVYPVIYPPIATDARLWTGHLLQFRHPPKDFSLFKPIP
jgi:hypothetical protein